MASLPGGLVTILQHAPLPPAALLAAADQQPLVSAIAGRDDLPTGAVEQALRPGAPLPAHVTAALVDRPLPARTVRHVLRTAGERRPAVLARLVRHNVPNAAADRRIVLDLDDRTVDEAVLANGRWPVDEQLRIVRRVGGTAALRWLAQLDPDVELSWDDLNPDNLQVDRLDADPVTALRALLRRPWLADLPLERAGIGLRSALATVTADERTQYRLLGTAQHLARFGRTTEAAGIIEALAHNPTATLTVQRRCRRLARWVRCHYLDGWLPTRPVTGPLWATDAHGQRAALDRLERHTRARHRTVWSAALLAGNPDLADDVRTRIISYLDQHLTAVETDPATLDLLANRLQVDQPSRHRWHTTARTRTRPDNSERPEPDDAADGTGDGWQHLHLDACTDPDAARRVGRGLARHLGTRTDAWTLAWLLLRDGWDAPLAELPDVVAALTRVDEVAA